MKLRNVALLLVATAPLAAHAEDWKGKGQAGLLISQGNTEAKSANAALELTRTADAWKHAFTAAALYGKSGEVQSAERWSICGTTPATSSATKPPSRTFSAK